MFDATRVKPGDRFRLKSHPDRVYTVSDPPIHRTVHGDMLGTAHHYVFNGVARSVDFFVFTAIVDDVFVPFDDGLIPLDGGPDPDAPPECTCDFSRNNWMLGCRCGRMAWERSRGRATPPAGRPV